MSLAETLNVQRLAGWRPGLPAPAVAAVAARSA